MLLTVAAVRANRHLIVCVTRGTRHSDTLWRWTSIAGHLKANTLTSMIQDDLSWVAW